MTKLIILGQAPSRVGDGRPFSGPSGKRLAALLGLRDYEQLAAQITLANIFDQPAVRQIKRGDHFDSSRAVHLAQIMLEEWSIQEEKVVVVACGHEVYRALIGERTQLFRGIRRLGVEIWCFPHPSGASAFWNTQSNRLLAANFLRRLLNREGISIAQ